MYKLKLKQMILMFFFVFSGALCRASCVTETQNGKDGHQVSIELTESTGASSSDKSNAITPFINRHVLSVVFCENLGQVFAEITTITGTIVDYTSVLTPNGLQFYIPNEGNYIVSFRLSNGDVYSGEFTVTD